MNFVVKLIRRNIKGFILSSKFYESNLVRCSLNISFLYVYILSAKGNIHMKTNNVYISWYGIFYVIKGYKMKYLTAKFSLN